MNTHHRLWFAVVLQAYADLEHALYDSLAWSQAAAFFLGDGAWAEGRRNVCDMLGVEPDQLARPARRIINARRLERGLPPLSTQTLPVPQRLPKQRKTAPAAVPSLPRLVATPAPKPAQPRSRGGHKSWPRDVFDPFRPLPSETRHQPAAVSGRAAA